jgi:hypothetical protein
MKPTPAPPLPPPAQPHHLARWRLSRRRTGVRSSRWQQQPSCIILRQCGPKQAPTRSTRCWCPGRLCCASGAAPALCLSASVATSCVHQMHVRRA